MDFNFFDAILDCVVVMDKSLAVHYCNEPAASLCNSSVRRMMNKPLNSFLSFKDIDFFQSGSEPELMDTREVEFTNIKTNESGLGQVTISAFENEGSKYYVLVLRNVTLEQVLHKKYHLQLEEKEVVIDQLKDAQRELENYSKNLEKMVEERTEEVRSANVMLNAIMDSLGQGFLVFDKTGKCSEFYTKACLQVLGTVPKDKMIWDVLNLNGTDTETFKMWIQAVFSNSLPFDSLKSLATTSLNPTENQYVNLDYFKIEDDNVENNKVVLVATDVTAEHIANKKLEQEKQFAKMIVKIVSNKNQFCRFLDSAASIIQDVQKSLVGDTHDNQLILRQLHTLEGESALFSISEVWTVSRQVQECIQGQIKQYGKIENIKLVQESHQKLIDAYQNYLKSQNQLFKALGIGKGQTFEITKETITSLVSYLESKSLSSEIINYVENELLSISVEDFVSHYNEAVALLADKLNKKVAPILWKGTDLRLRPEHYSELFSSLIHAFRNMVDHGVEPIEDRQMMGKSEQALIEFHAELKSIANKPCLELVIKDDGHGIDTDRLRKKIEANGEDTSSFSNEQIMQRIFDSGLSTRDNVSEFSGRGVGMNAVKEAAENLGGQARVDSEPGKGTCITIQVPLIEKMSIINKLSA